MIPAWFELLIKKLGNKKWYVYAKPPFGGPEHVLRATSAATPHRMAISNYRLTAFDGERVSFRWRDYARSSKQRGHDPRRRQLSLCPLFFLHVLPKGFVRIRRYGLLSKPPPQTTAAPGNRAPARRPGT